MEKFLFTLIFIYLINPIFPTTHFEKPQRYLHVVQDENHLNKPTVIENTDLDLAEFIQGRYKRDLSSSDRNENLKNITTKVRIQTINSLLLSYQTRLSDCFRKRVEKVYASFLLIIRPAVLLRIHLKL